MSSSDSSLTVRKEIDGGRGRGGKWGAREKEKGQHSVQEKGEARVDVLLLLSLLSGSLRGSVTTSSGTASSGTTGSGGSTGTDVGQEVLDVLALEGLGEEGSPDGLDLDVGSLGEGDKLVGLCERKEGRLEMGDAKSGGKRQHSALSSLLRYVPSKRCVVAARAAEGEEEREEVREGERTVISIPSSARIRAA
jgi:hypothetical protein